MNTINTILKGNIINLTINGKLEQKTCKSKEDAVSTYKMILAAKENPTDFEIKKLYGILNDTTRIATIAGLEVDVIDGKTYLEGFNTPIPQNITDMILEYYENNFPTESIINFWKLLMANPDIRVRDTLFTFLTKFNFVLTEHGYFVTYKAVKDFVEPKVNETTKSTKPVIDDLTKFINTKYDQVKNKWKQSPKNFTVYQKDNNYLVAETKTFKGDATSLGLLNELYLSVNPVIQPVPTETIKAEIVVAPTKTYTDKHTGKMRIKLGEAVKQERKTCVGDPSIECASSLHTGHVQYVKAFASSSDTILCCLINPAHVVAVPKYDNTKLRSCEYFPLSVVDNFNTLNINTQQSFFESDYIAYEKTELEKQLDLIKNNQLPIEASINSKKEERSMEELLKIIESRLIDIK